MLQYITGPKDKFGNSKIANLKNVSNIAFIEETNRFGEIQWKIIFNFNYSVSLKNDNNKLISDYVYFVFTDKSEYDTTTNELSKLINDYGWIAPIINGEVSRITNPDCISFIATDPRKNRVILNLSTSVSFWNDYSRRTSDFIYIDFDTKDEYLENLEYIKGQLDREL